MQRDMITDLQDLRGLEWSHIRRSSGTAGSFLKAYAVKNGKTIYYKLSDYDSCRGIVGHECVNELIVDRLLTILGIPHLSVQLVHALVRVDGRDMETWVCRSEDFKRRGESKLPMNLYFQLEAESGESPMGFCLRHGWGEYVRQMLVIDYLILNRDRHGANMEVLKDRKTGKVRPAPLFDHGLSLVFSCRTEDAVRHFDPMADRPVQCFVGMRSAWENILSIPGEELPDLLPLKESDRNVIFRELDGILGDVWLDKIWEMIWQRWCRYQMRVKSN